MIGCAARRKKLKKRTVPKKQTTKDVWYAPKIQDVYAQFQIAQTMLNRIPDAELAVVKREMGIVEDMLWQFCHQ